MSQEFDENSNDSIIREKILDLALDEVEHRQDLLEYGVPHFLRKSNEKKKRYLFGGLTEEERFKIQQDEDEDAYSSRRRPDSTDEPVPEIVLSGRSSKHFNGEVGKIFAYNLLYEVTDEDLETLFRTFGPLKRAAVNYNRDGRSMGTAFIVFKNRSDAQNAFRRLDGHQLDGRRLFLRLLDHIGLDNCDKRTALKKRGDQIPIDNQIVFPDRERITEQDLDMDLDSYVSRRKRAKTWNYY